MARRRLFLTALLLSPALNSAAAATHPRTRRNRRLAAGLGIVAVCIWLGLR